MNERPRSASFHNSPTVPSKDFFIGQALCNVLPKEFPLSFQLGGMRLAADSARMHLEWCAAEGMESAKVPTRIRAECRRIASEYGAA